jgi:hypothetical protein
VKDVQTTNNLGLKKPGAEDVVNIEDLNSNSDALDGKFGASSGHGHTGAAGDGPKIGSGGLAAGAATDTVIGSRTVSDTTAPTGDSGTPTTLFGWLANMIKAITGGATWRTLPGMTIAAIKTILDAATNAGTASALMKRDSSGRAQVAAPSAAADIARKDTVDAVQSNLSTHAAVGSAAHGATSAPTVSTLMARDSAGRAQVVAPSVSADIANKGYVDTAVSGATIPDASLTVKGKVQLSSAVNSTSEVLAATPKAVKDAYDRGSAGVTAAAAAQAKADGAAQARGAAPADLNTAINPGTYSIYLSSNHSNIPAGMPSYCILTVEASASDSYLKQTITGILNDGYIVSRARTENGWRSWVPVWTSGNDGAGSGLDADMLEGIHASMSHIPTYYIPVVNPGAGPIEIGQYIDFHRNGSTNDHDGRLQIGAVGDGGLYFNGVKILGQNDLIVRDNVGVLEFYTGGVWKPVSSVSPTKFHDGYIAWNSTPATLLSLTGRGTINALTFESSYSNTYTGQITMSIQLDGQAPIEFIKNTVLDSNQRGILAPTGRCVIVQRGSVAPPIPACNISFANSCIINGFCTDSNGSFRVAYSLL